MNLTKTSNKTVGSLGQFFYGNWPFLFLLLLLVVTMLSPVYTSDFLHHDDWVHVSRPFGSQCTDDLMYGYANVTGRQITEQIICALFGSIRRVEDAKYVRLFSAVAIGLFCLGQYSFFRFIYLSSVWSALLSLAITSLPGMLSFAFWLTASSILYGLFASLIAAYCCCLALRSSQSRPKRSLLLILALIFELVSCWIYQTAAMYFWCMLAAVIIQQIKLNKLNLQQVIVTGSIGGAAAMAYLIWFSLLSDTQKQLSLLDPSRGNLFQGLGTTFTWFTSRAVPRALNMWFVDAPDWVHIIVGVVFVGAIVLASAKLFRASKHLGQRTAIFRTLVFVAILLVLGMASYLPMLITPFNLEVYRSLVTLSSFVLIVAVLNILYVFDNLPVAKAEQLAWWSAAGLFMLAIFAHATLQTQMVTPSSIEYRYYRAALLQLAKKHTSAKELTLTLVLPEPTTAPFTDEFPSISVVNLDARFIIQRIVQDANLPFKVEGKAVYSEIPGAVGDNPQIDVSPLRDIGVYRDLLP